MPATPPAASEDVEIGSFRANLSGTTDGDPVDADEPPGFGVSRINFEGGICGEEEGIANR